MPDYEFIAFEQRTVTSKSGLNELELTETETLPIVEDEKTMTNARKVLELAGFEMKSRSKYQNLPSETWEKNRTIVFSDHTKGLAKDVLSEEIKELEVSKGLSEMKLFAYETMAAARKKEIERLTNEINQASIWKRIKFLFGGKL